jgi:pimeloyl-ACP methyl ester carboxylesterase
VPMLRTAFRALQRVAPARAAQWAETLFFTPPRSRLTPDQREVIEQARPFSVRVDGRRLAVWSWGDGPIIYLVHGWGSRGGRLAAFVAPLVAAGYQVVTYDAPAHGASEGRLSSMPEFARALRGVVDAVGPMQGMIAHSLGASASALAMHQGLRVPRAVFLAPAADPPRFALRFGSEALGLDAATVARVRANSERRLGVRWSELQVPPLARALRVPLLLFHDRDDTYVPWTDGSAISSVWADSELVTTVGLGHRGIVRAPEVIDRAVHFLEGIPAARGGADGASHAEGRWIEDQLWQREARPWARALAPA